MPLPRLGQYQMALQHPATAFADAELRAARVETNPMGLPRVISGGFALTYHLTGGGREWAVRCFHREATDLQRRYQAIAAVAGGPAGGPFVPVEYLARGVQVEGRWYPVTKMPWLHALPIGRYIESNLSPPALDRLAGRFRALVAELGARGIAHGDLQHGNILVDAAGGLMLVDYDGMYVPALCGMAANESGHVNYQHPGRSTQFDTGIDRFSAIVILVALRALAAEPGLWARYANGDNLLFKRTDFLDPHGSALFRDLAALPAVRAQAERLQAICLGRYADVPVLNLFLAGSARAAPHPAAVPRARRAPAAARRAQFEVVAGADRQGLIRREGDVVTVVGQVTALQRGLTRFGKPYAFLCFGSYRGGAFTLVLWAQALEAFAQGGRAVESYKGQWVSATGLITVYQARGGGRLKRPQLVVEAPSDVRVLAAEDALALLGGAAPAASTPGRPLARAATDALTRLYGGTGRRGTWSRGSGKQRAKRTRGRGRVRGGSRRAGQSRAGSVRRAAMALLGRINPLRLLVALVAVLLAAGSVALAGPHLPGAALPLLLGSLALAVRVGLARP